VASRANWKARPSAVTGGSAPVQIGPPGFARTGAGWANHQHITTAPNSDSDADLPRRKGARTMAVIPADMLRSLNRGEIETRTLVEW